MSIHQSTVAGMTTTLLERRASMDKSCTAPHAGHSAWTGRVVAQRRARTPRSWRPPSLIPAGGRLKAGGFPCLTRRAACFVSAQTPSSGRGSQPGGKVNSRSQRPSGLRSPVGIASASVAPHSGRKHSTRKPVPSSRASNSLTASLPDSATATTVRRGQISVTHSTPTTSSYERRQRRS